MTFACPSKYHSGDLSAREAFPYPGTRLGNRNITAPLCLPLRLDQSRHDDTIISFDSSINFKRKGKRGRWKSFAFERANGDTRGEMERERWITTRRIFQRRKPTAGGHVRRVSDKREDGEDVTDGPMNFGTIPLRYYYPAACRAGRRVFLTRGRKKKANN